MKKYNQEHEWISIEGDIATVGISTYAVEQLGDITFIELPEIDKKFDMGQSAAFVESVKAASDIYSPISGTITQVNADLEQAPEKLNEDAQNIWIFKLKISDKTQLDSLMDEDAYKKYIESL